jgi:hypothetical protein
MDRRPTGCAIVLLTAVLAFAAWGGLMIAASWGVLQGLLAG